MLESMVIVHASRCRNEVNVGLAGDRFAWLLDVLVPAGLHVVHAQPINEGSPSIADTYDEVTEPFLQELQRRFDGWTDLGSARTAPLRVRGGYYGDHYQLQYRRMIIATTDPGWKEVLEAAERVFREGHMGWQHALSAEARQGVLELLLRQITAPHEQHPFEGDAPRPEGES
jgi:hypothetical protein